MTCPCGDALCTGLGNPEPVRTWVDDRNHLIAQAYADGLIPVQRGESSARPYRPKHRAQLRGGER